jgi:hypothetical protein
MCLEGQDNHKEIPVTIHSFKAVIWTQDLLNKKQEFYSAEYYDRWKWLKYEDFNLLSYNGV